MNESEWDEHVSFSVLSLALSPCGQFLLLATGLCVCVCVCVCLSVVAVVTHIRIFIPKYRRLHTHTHIYIYIYIYITDKSRLIMYRLGAHHQLRSFYGHSADEYSNPRCVYVGEDTHTDTHTHTPKGGGGKYVFCSSQQGNEIVGWCVASERVVVRLQVCVCVLLCVCVCVCVSVCVCVCV